MTAAPLAVSYSLRAFILLLAATTISSQCLSGGLRCRERVGCKSRTKEGHCLVCYLFSNHGPNSLSTHHSFIECWESGLRRTRTTFLLQVCFQEFGLLWNRSWTILKFSVEPEAASSSRDVRDSISILAALYIGNCFLLLVCTFLVWLGSKILCKGSVTEQTFKPK